MRILLNDYCSDVWKVKHIWTWHLKKHIICKFWGKHTKLKEKKKKMPPATISGNQRYLQGNYIPIFGSIDNVTIHTHRYARMVWKKKSIKS